MGKWACPKCGAVYHKHGKGECMNSHGQCEGLICDCEFDTTEGHGESLSDPCENANCYHCGWGGTLPIPKRKPLPWEKKALAAGWTPPVDSGL